MSDEFQQRRRGMVQEQLVERDITDEDVLDAFRTVPREVFVESEYREQAYEDRALPTRSGQTISQPYMVARMTQELGVEVGDRVLEVGTGSGYQSAILAEMGARVYTVETVSELSKRAAERLSSLGYDDRVTFKVGDGTIGWEEHAPYDGTVVTAGAPEVPEPLKQQTAVGGRIVIPVGTKHQQSITIFERIGESEWEKRESIPCVFVSLVGEEGWSSGK